MACFFFFSLFLTDSAQDAAGDSAAVATAAAEEAGLAEAGGSAAVATAAEEAPIEAVREAAAPEEEGQPGDAPLA